MVVDHFIDMQEGAEHLWLRAWRCMNCGNVMDPAIVSNRLGQQSPVAGLMRRWSRTSRRKYAAIALDA